MITSNNTCHKVLLFSPHPSVGGGVVNFTQTLKRCLSSGIQVDEFIIGQRPGFFRRALRGIVPLYDAIRLAIVLLGQRHDVYHINPSFDARSILRDGLFLVVLRTIRRKNILVFIHGWDDEYYCRIAASPTWRFIFCLAYRHADQILVLASSFAKKLQLLGLAPDSIRPVTTMFDGELIRHVSRQCTDHGVQILFLSRFVAGKGIFELLDAFNAISQLFPEAVLVMTGDGPERERAREWCRTHDLENSVSFPGYVEGPDKAQLLVNSDIFALPSLSEGCPISLLEAMGAGLPVIVTAVGGIPDIITDGVNGVLLETPDSSSIENALGLLIGDADLRAKMGRRNREDAWRKYEARSVTASIESVYCQLGRIDT